MNAFLTLALFLTLTFSSSHAQDTLRSFSFEHGDCKTRVPQKEHFLQELFISTMKERGYKPEVITEQNPLNEGELYMSYQQTHPSGFIYKECLVEISLKRAEMKNGSKNDEVLYQHQVLRRLPRVTFKGKERCRRALKDSFVHIPYCIRPKAP